MGKHYFLLLVDDIVHVIIEWRGGAAESKHYRHVALHDEGKEDAGGILWRSGEHGGVCPQSITDEEPDRDFAILGMVRVEARCLVLPHLPLHQARQGDETAPLQAGRQEHLNCVPRIRTRGKGIMLIQFDPRGKHVRISWDVIFDKKVSQARENPSTREEDGLHGAFTVAHLVVQEIVACGEDDGSSWHGGPTCQGEVDSGWSDHQRVLSSSPNRYWRVHLSG